MNAPAICLNINDLSVFYDRNNKGLHEISFHVHKGELRKDGSKFRIQGVDYLVNPI